MRPTRLVKAAGEFNIGMSALVEFLERKGIRVDSTPNTKLTPDQYRLLVVEFGDQNPVTLEFASKELKTSIPTLVQFLVEKGVPKSQLDSESDRILEREYALLKTEFASRLTNKDDLLKEYFDLNVVSDNIYSAGPVESGVHGIEMVDGEYYASLYHIQNFIAKGELKSFLFKFKGSSGLSEFARVISDQYKFEQIFVKYKSQNFSIKKYPYSAILNYFIDSKTKGEKELEEQIRSESTIGICELGAKSYRRFKELKPIEIGKINFFVGQNNAGKSTVVEMLRILISYLKQRDHSFIDLNGINYGRILNNTLTDDGKNMIELTGVFDNCTFQFSFLGRPNQSKSNIVSLRADNSYFRMDLDFRNPDIQVTLKIKDDDITLDEMFSLGALSDIQVELNEIELVLDNQDLSLTDKLDLNDRKNKLEKDLKTAKQAASKASKKKLPKDELLFFEISKEKIGSLSIRNILNEVFSINDDSIRGKKEGGDIAAMRQELKQRRHIFHAYIQRLFERINTTDVHYLEGTSIKLGAVLKSGDNQDGLLNSVRYLKGEGVFEKANHMTLAFIKKWLSSESGFGIAEDIRVKGFENEVFTIELLGDDEKWQHLGDYGLGTQRLFELILSISRIIHHYQKVKESYKPLLLVEEPEVHIHPAWQSKLTDFFYQVNQEHSLRFIVETHSEYIIRQTQLIGLEKDLFKKSIGQNPFNVTYFDKKDGPYMMKYEEDGNFDRDFGNGFYDVVDDIAMEIFLNKQKQRK